MRNLIAFFMRFQIFLVFAILQSFALSTYIRFTEFPRIQWLTSTAKVNAQVLEMKHDVTKHFSLEDANRKLMRENKRLREKLKESLYKKEKGRITINDTAYRQQYQYIPATVIDNTYDMRNNYMTINVGRRDGIEKTDGVISSNGVVGYVHYVGETHSLVKTVLTKNINIDVMLQKTGAFGLLKWDGKHPRRVTVTGISNDMQVKRWTKVVTRGGSGIFPRGIPVGMVYSRKYIEGKPLWDITLILAEDFRSIQHVYVIKNLMLEELDQLKKHIPVEKEDDDDIE